MIFAALFSVCAASCTMDVPSEGMETADVSADFDVTFIASCQNPTIDFTATGKAINGASASACRRTDGSFVGPVSFSGICTGNIANINGVLECKAGINSLTLSFFASCTPISVSFNKAGVAVVSASATACRRTDGTRTGTVSFSGSCSNDITNENGVLKCT
jgi:hypothetical protein